jgi:hypothetical protein
MILTTIWFMQNKETMNKQAKKNFYTEILRLKKLNNVEFKINTWLKHHIVVVSKQTCAY